MDITSKLLATPKVDSDNQPLVQPIYQTSVFQMPSYEQAIDCEHAERPNSYYTRWGNPTTAYLEKQLTTMSGYQECLVFPSGMSAITTTLFSLLRAGDHIYVSTRLYGDTLKFFVEELPRLGVSISFFDIETINNIHEKNLPKGSQCLIYFEGLSNPDLVLADFKRMKEVAQQLGAISICDTTFIPPLNLAINLSHYVDISIHSLTKYLSGHFSSFGGAVLSSDKLVRQIWHTQALYGACPDPQACWMISQGIKTLDVRLKTQNHSAMLVANYLKAHSKIKAVKYPLLEGNPRLALENHVLNGGGGVISFFLKGNDQATIVRFLESTKLIGLFVSLGGIHSCIEHAQSMSHSMVTEEHQQSAGMEHIPEGLIRLSIGLESVNDIIGDLDQALTKC